MFCIENNEYNIDYIKPYEALMSTGNGYLSLRASFEFDVSFSKQNELYTRFPDNVTLEKLRNPYGKWGTFISGVVGKHPLLNEEMVNLPYFLGFNLYCDDKKIEILDNVESFCQKLNIKNSVYEYTIVFIYNGEKIEIRSQRVCDRVNTHYHYQNINIKTDSEKEFVIESFVDTSVTTNGYNHFVSRELDVVDGIKNIQVVTDLDSKVNIQQRDICTGQFLKKEIVNDRVSMFYSFCKNVVLEKNTFVSTNRENVVSQIEDYEFNLFEHEKIWNEIWEMSDVIIKGDEQLQKYVRYSIYHLIRSKKLDDELVAIDAKGVCGEAYFGHYFWDTEIYMLPFYLYTNPKQARELLMFRYNTLNPAINNAKAYGYIGAKYPWESSISGEEQCPNWQYKDFEIHISFDIAYAMYKYYKVTDDVDTMKNNFLDCMIEISKFIVSRGVIEKDGYFHINGVMGPDEYLAFTSDNAFTNYMAKFTLKKTVELINAFDLKCDWTEKFIEIEQKMFLTIDTDNKFIWQCKDFDSFEDIDFDKMWLDRSQAFGKFISQERNYRSKALKQGDVTCLLYLFEKEFDNEYIKNNLEYYLPITTHDSSLSYIIHSILFSKIGETEAAYDYMLKASGIDFDELGCGEGIHIANCGGIYQGVIYGFAGLINPMFTEKLEFRPNLPDTVSEINFKLNFKNKLYNILVTKDTVEVVEV